MIRTYIFINLLIKGSQTKACWKTERMRNEGRMEENG